MLRLELVRAIDTVWSAVTESDVVEFLKDFLERSHLREHGEPGTGRPVSHRLPHPMGFDVFQKYAVAAHGFGPLERQIVPLFELERLADPGFWHMLLVAVSSEANFEAVVRPILQGANSLTGLRQLLAPEAIEIPRPSKEEPATTLERFSILVVEDKGRLSRPVRLVNVLQGVNSLYEVHASLLSLPADTLLVAACDSGSDKAFDFLGISKAIEALKETILSLWDRVVFFRERKLLVNVQLVAQALPVLEQISALAEQKAIGPELAEILRRQVIDGATKLVEAGAITSELSATRHHDVRALAAPEPKLLAAPQPPPHNRPNQINHLSQNGAKSRGSRDKSALPEDSSRENVTSAGSTAAF